MRFSSSNCLWLSLAVLAARQSLPAVNALASRAAKFGLSLLVYTSRSAFHSAVACFEPCSAAARTTEAVTRASCSLAYLRAFS